MKKNIYMLLNEVSTDTSGYEEVELTEEELSKYKANIRKKVKRKKINKTLRISVSVAACIVLVLIITFFQSADERLGASRGTNHNTLRSMLGLNNTLEDYTIEIDESKRIEVGNVTLNSVAFDDGQLVIYSTYYYDEADEVPRLSEGKWERDYGLSEGEWLSYIITPEFDSQQDSANSIANFNGEISEKELYIQRIYINGKEMNDCVNGKLYANEDGVLQSTARYTINMNTIEFPAQVKLEICKNDSAIEEEVTFTFELKENQMIPNEKDINLNQNVTLPDGNEVKFTRFVQSTLGIRIYAEYVNPIEHPIYLDSLDEHQYYAYLASLSCQVIDEKRLVFYPEQGDNLQYVLPDLEQLYFKMSGFVYDSEKDGIKQFVLDEIITIPLQ